MIRDNSPESVSFVGIHAVSSRPLIKGVLNGICQLRGLRMLCFSSACWLLALGTTVVPEPPVWAVVRSKDGDFALSMPAQPTFKAQNVKGSVGALETLTYSCQIKGSLYLVQRTRSSQPVTAGQVAAELARLRDRYLGENGKLVKETKIVVDGVVGDDFTYTAPTAGGDGRVTKRIRHFLTAYFYYVLAVTSPAGAPLPEDAARFMSSLTFEAVVKAHYSRMKMQSKPVAPPQEKSQKTASRRDGNAPKDQTKVEPADSTPEDAMKTFLLALAAQDEATLRAVTLPDDEFDWLLKGRRASPELIARMKAGLENNPMRRLKAGDPVRMPDGEARVIQPIDVRKGRVVLWPEGAPLPSRLENVGGHWKVFARPFIAVRKSAEINRTPIRPKAGVNARGPGR
jgi:hypothetical protein